MLGELEAELRKENTVLDPFFTKSNKLRFLQANKFKVEKTLESMEENTKWRVKAFPVQADQKTEQLLVDLL